MEASIFTVSCYLAILTGRRIPDVIRPYETADAAIAQCTAWTRKGPSVSIEAVPGYIYFAVYGTADDTVRVEYHTLELADPEDAEPAEGTGPLHLDLCPKALKEVDA